MVFFKIIAGYFEIFLPKSCKCNRILSGKVKNMSVNTSNVYGKISISDEAIGKIAKNAALECYGIVDTVSRKFSQTLSELFKKSTSRGIKVVTQGDRIFIDVYVIIKYGVSISAVAESLKEGVKYKVENFTGMIVDTVNVNIIGVKL